MLPERDQLKWERRLRAFCIVGGTAFIASLLVARPLTESFELMWHVVPLLIISLFALLIGGGTVWLILQISIAHQAGRDMAARLRPASIRSPRGF
ncbi:MAG: hypothetical protein LPK88_12800 [Alphaproteobacteria bacterium]|nr:hypothetical protein [Alphaproteobacteria bacterium]MDX5417177.1 hypothetical protein [Alphaproteobacteria bacterium]MDX5494614.1 hypothetical protein [Alphaproteobacteria bacterium]